MTFVKGMKRPLGAGMRKGFKYPNTRDREAQLQAFRDHVVSELKAMTTAQVAHAQGVSYMVLRAPDGTYTRATDVNQIDAACVDGGTNQI